MHTRTHLSLLREALLLSAVLACGAMLAAFFFATQRPVGYTTVVSFDVILEKSSSHAQDEFGGAYSDLKAAEVFGQNVMSWMMTPAVVASIYDAAQVPYTIDSLSRFTNRFTTKQYGAQNIIIQFSEAHQNTAYALASAMTSVVEEKARTVLSDTERTFSLRAAEPVVVQERWSPLFVVIIAGLSGVVAGIVLTYARQFFREEQ